ncbi:MAG: hypothetical protein IKL57_01730 [Oscillospiraceae bacterium]|nr:hypothetical protein [Oscillospiraceae bacterium]
MNMHLDEQGWGEAVLENIWAVLESVDRVFRPCFGSSMNTNDLLVIHCDDHPVTYSDYNVILLSAGNRFWCQYAYQFTHEYCHFQIGGNVPRQLRWFEESLCELASHFFLPRIGDLWKINPPYPNWKDYAENFQKYSMLDQQKAIPFDLDFSDNQDSLVHLIQNEYDRPMNTYVALKLMPVFEATPQLWSVVHIIKSISKDLTFSESLRCWKNLSPEEFRKDIDTVAEIFSIAL